MPHRFRHIAAAAALGLVLVFASCDRSPTSPRPSQPGAPQPVPVTTVRIELVAPSEIAPGESVQLTANAIKSDGSVENVSSAAEWGSGLSQVLTVSSTGLATGQDRGATFVMARFGGLSAAAQILVLPRGTFLLTGTIRESGFGIANVTLTVISGIGEGLTTVSDLGGFYALYGVGGPVRILAKKDGYLIGTHQVDVTAHRTYDFVMAAERSRSDYRGTYTLTVSVPSCTYTEGMFPDAARRRVYTANVAQEGAQLTVSLTDADLLVTNGRGNRFTGFIDTTEVIRFPISDPDYDYSDSFDYIAERFTDTALLVYGTATVRGTPALLSGTLAGWIVIASRPTPPFTPFSSRCYSGHTFEMVKR